MKKLIFAINFCLYVANCYSQTSVVYNLKADAVCAVSNQTSQITTSGDPTRVLNVYVQIIPFVQGSLDALYYASGITFSNNSIFANTPNKKYWVIPKDPSKTPYSIVGGGSSAVGDVHCICSGSSDGIGCTLVSGSDSNGDYKTCSAGTGCLACCSLLVETGILSGGGVIVEAVSINFNGVIYN